MLRHLLLTLFFSCSISFVFAQIEYQFSFKGEFPRDIEETLRQHTKTVSHIDRPPSSELGLKRRVEEDCDVIKEILKLYGYYSSKVTPEIKQKKNKRYQITFNLYTGPLFKISKLHVKGIEESSFLLAVGSPLNAYDLLQMRQRILKKLHNEGYPFAQGTTPKIKISFQSVTGSVSLLIKPGDRLHFGATTIKGLSEVNRRYIRERLYWKEGEWFNKGAIKRTQQVLENSTLFERVSITYPSFKKEESLPITIEVKESKFKTIGGGLNYSSHKGAGVMAEWQHRNIGGMGNLLTTSGFISTKERHAKITYKHFNFLSNKQTLTTSLEDGKEKTKAYTNLYQSAKIKLYHPFSKYHVNFSYGSELTREKASRSNNENLFVILSFPLQMTWKKTNTLYYPSIGKKLHYTIVPSFNLSEENLQFLLQQMKFNLYFPIVKKGKISGNLSVNIASITGASTQKIAPPNRLYGGSEENLRGYGYMSVSPLEGNKPIGGRSMLIYGFDIHTPIFDKISGGPFFEIGNIFDSTLPKFDQKLLKSTGLTLSYLSAIGPLNVTLAFPMDKRKGLDSSMQLYLTFAKSF